MYCLYACFYKHVGTCVCMHAEAQGSWNHHQLLFPLIHRGRLFQSSPELADIVNLNSQLALGFPSLSLGGCHFRQPITPICHLHDFLGPELQFLHLFGNCFIYWNLSAALEKKLYHFYTFFQIHVQLCWKVEWIPFLPGDSPVHKSNILLGM